MDTKKIKAVLYSVSQDCFHLETLDEYIKKNSEDCLEGKSSDYKLIGIFDNETDSDMYIRRFRVWRDVIISIN